MYPALSEAELQTFRTAGFVVLRGFFDDAEMDLIGREVSSVLADDRGRRFRRAQDGIEYDMENLPVPGTASMELERYSQLVGESASAVDERVALMRTRTSTGFVAERSHPLGEAIVAGDKVWSLMGQLLGEDFIFAGSEVMCGSWNNWRGQGWHSDRGMADGGSDLDELNWTRAKLMMYTTNTSAECGALRVIPASHRAPLHGELTRMIQSPDFDERTAHGELLPLLVDESAAVSSAIFEQQRQRLEAGELPWAFCFESKVGDALLFNHCLMHAVYHKPANRAFVASKFAARPRDDMQIRLYSGYYKIDVGALTSSSNARLRELASREQSMIVASASLGSKL
jgi:ectoine hydroxylase-related dioxygenase (phytanoyl-CoA dioxygenase family)